MQNIKGEASKKNGDHVLVGKQQKAGIWRLFRGILSCYYCLLNLHANKTPVLFAFSARYFWRYFWRAITYTPGRTKTPRGRGNRHNADFTTNHHARLASTPHPPPFFSPADRLPFLLIFSIFLWCGYYWFFVFIFLQLSLYFLVLYCLSGGIWYKIRFYMKVDAVKMVCCGCIFFVLILFDIFCYLCRIYYFCVDFWC